MRQSLVEAIYHSLPVLLQHAACSAYGLQERRIRLGKLFRARLDELLVSERWSRSHIEAFQDAEVRRVVAHAYAHVPFYRERMSTLKLRPQDIRGVADLPKLPLLTREDVRLNFDKLTSDDVHKRELMLSRTSGTTGKSLRFQSTSGSISFQWAVWWRHRLRFGVSPKSWHANFTGKLVVLPEQSRPPYGRWNLPLHQLLINFQQLTRAKIRDVVALLNSVPLEFWSGYPSIIHALVLLAAESDIRLDVRPRFVFTGAENVLARQARDIQNFTAAQISDQYGFAEACGNASQCEHFRYHEDFEFGVLECLDGQPHGLGTRGRVVCTGFGSPAFPFIRYDVGDLADWADPSFRCTCGRESRVITSIEGRSDDAVLTPEGLRVTAFDYVFDDTDNVREAQVVQEELGSVCLNIVRRPVYSAKDEAFIRAEIARWISPRLTVSFNYVDEIEREANGKFRAVKSLLGRGPSNEVWLATSPKLRATGSP